MVVGSRSSLRRPNLRGDPNHTSPEQPARDPSRARDESAKRARIPSTNDQERLKKRRKIVDDVKAAQLRIPLRGRKFVSPPIVTQSLPDQSQTSTPLDSPTTQYDQIRRIEERARVAIRGGAFRAPDDKRSLRSKDGGSRSKSELAQYFPNYEQMLSFEPIPPDPLNPDTKITILDDTPGFRPARPKWAELDPPDPFGAAKPLHHARRVDLLKMAGHSRTQLGDPLGPETFIKIHKKEERREKQIRNNEKEKAQHEKYHLERLLADLRGPDWLRTMGISGITDTEKKKYEPKRIQLVQEVKAMIDKYEAWKLMEKRQRQRELEVALAEEGEDDGEEEDDDDDDDENEEEEEEDTEEEEEAENGEGKESGTQDDETQSSSAASSSSNRDVKSEFNDDALAARQLLQEAEHSVHRPRKKIPELPLAPAPPYEPFVSFYKKRHLRDAAIGSHGRRSRGITAFGQPVPELIEREFELPESYITDEAIRASQRRRRRKLRSEGST